MNQIRRAMLSQLRLLDETSQTYKPQMAMPTPVLPSLRVQTPTSFRHNYSAHYAAALPSLPLPPFRVDHASVISPSSGSTHKCSLAFILAEPTAPAVALARSHSEMSSCSEADSLDLDRPPHSLKHKRRSGASPAAGSKSKYCIVDGCTSRAKHARKCWRHGGSVKCKVADCINRAKSRGVCWSHGGGTTCSHPNCGTIAVSHGFCWAHGGGKRCEVGGCSRPAYERTQNLCSTHFKQTKATKASSSRAAAPY